MRVGLIGAGVISAQYLESLTRFPDLNVAFIADAMPERARQRAEEFLVPGWGSVDELLRRDDLELVVNLTPPGLHVELGMRALESGKHVWSEKPIGLDVASAQAMLQRAADQGLRVGVAPDTILGSGLQTARRLLLEGAIGDPVSAIAMFRSPGPDIWHPEPAFLFQRGAGPLFDMGPYYLTALVTLMGPVASVQAMSGRASETRTIKAGPRAGDRFPVEVDTHVSALLRLQSGAIAQCLFSFDAPSREFLLEVSGTLGTMSVPDPNLFPGTVSVHTRRTQATAVFRGSDSGSAEAEPSRGVGVLDMARAIRAGQPHRASGELALHVLDVLESIERAATTGMTEQIATEPRIPEPLPVSWNPYQETGIR